MNDLKDDLASLQLNESKPPPRKRLWFVLVLIALLALAGFTWLSTIQSAATEVTIAYPEIGETHQVSGSPILTASGYVVARRQAIVSAKIQGRLSELHVEEGSRVAHNEIIARLDAEDFSAQVQRAYAQLQQSEAQVTISEANIKRADASLLEARRQWSVNEQLARDELVPVDDLKASWSRVQVLEADLAHAQAEAIRSNATRQHAKADVAYAEALLDNTVIRAPFAGVIVRKMAEVGESVAPIPPGVNLSTSSGAIVTLADLDTLEVEVDVAESNVAQLSATQPAEVTVEAFPNKRYRAELRQIIPTADRTRATVMVKVTILDTDPNLKPEMSARATFLASPLEAMADKKQSPVLIVPENTVVTRNGRSHVFVITDRIANLVPVTTGGFQKNFVVIEEGLSGSETLILNAPDNLEDGDEVTIRSSS